MAKAPETKTDVAVVEKPGALAVYDYGSDAGSGFENTTQADLTIPFLGVMQSNSPEVEAGNCKMGDIVNSVTGEVIDGSVGVPFIPCHKEILWVEWRPRAAGGGIAARHSPASDVVQKAKADRGEQMGKITLANGNDLVETHYIYLLLLTPDGTATDGFAVLSCASTKITPAKKFTTALYMLKGKPPLFASRARLRTVKEENEKGRFANVEFRPLSGSWADSLINPTTNRELLEEGRAFREMIVSGAAKMSDEVPQGDAPPAGAQQGKASVKTGKAPF